MYNGSLGRFVGRVEALCDDGYTMLVQHDGTNHQVRYNEKQCRRLVKKQRRRVWVKFDDSNVVHRAYQNKSQALFDYNPDSLVEFVEVKRAVRK